jgi:hypothetical protein
MQVFVILCNHRYVVNSKTLPRRAVGSRDIKSVEVSACFFVNGLHRSFHIFGSHI